jgi:hypothetical protein
MLGGISGKCWDWYVRNLWIRLSATSAGAVKSETRVIYMASTGMVQSKACGIYVASTGTVKVGKLVYTLQNL